jgi:hypothetical protein
MCEEVKCDWKCKKPTLCPKPKCMLQCEKAACEAQDDEPTPQPRPCCPCSNEIYLQLAVDDANTKPLGTLEKDMIPSLVEMQHTMKLHEQEGQQTCCPCETPTETVRKL